MSDLKPQGSPISDILMSLSLKAGRLARDAKPPEDAMLVITEAEAAILQVITEAIGDPVEPNVHIIDPDNLTLDEITGLAVRRGMKETQDLIRQRLGITGEGDNE